MSALEVSARPFLEPIFLGERIQLDLAATRTVAEWLTMKIMVADRAPPPRPAISDTETRSFGAERVIPHGLRLLLYGCGAGHWTAAWRRSAGYLSILPAKTDPARHNNSAAYSFGAGAMFVQGWFFGEEAVARAVEVGKLGTPIWPPSAELITWPPSRVLSPQQADFLADDWGRLVQSPLIRVVD